VFVIAGYTGIADVSNSLLKLLRDNMEHELIAKPELIGMCSPEEENDFRLILYLYHIEANYDYRNVPPRTSLVPLTLDLYYLMTAKSSAEINSRSLDENTILGNAMLIFHENPILSASSLEGSLAENNDEIKITMIDTDKHLFSSKIKESEKLLYRNVVCYKVGPVFIGGSGPISGRRVTSF
jgi:hypothetical protein